MSRLDELARTVRASRAACMGTTWLKRVRAEQRVRAALHAFFVEWEEMPERFRSDPTMADAYLAGQLAGIEEAASELDEWASNRSLIDDFRKTIATIARVLRVRIDHRRAAPDAGGPP